MKSTSYMIWNTKSKDTIVCIHGYGDSADMFEPISKLFPDKQVISINLPMHLGGEKVYTITELAEYTKNILNELEISGYQLIGFSLGGLVANELAANNNKISKLILMNSFPLFIDNRKYRDLIQKVSVFLQNKYMLYTYSRISTNSLIRFLIRDMPLNPQAKKHMRKNYYSVFGTLINGISYYGLEKYKQLKIPKSIILAKDDSVIKYKTFLNCAQKYQLEFSAISEGGHASKNTYWQNCYPELNKILQTQKTNS